MELALSFSMNTASLNGYPIEYNPRLAVWTTDPTQRMTIAPGKAVDVIETKPRAKDSMWVDSIKPVVFSALTNGKMGGSEEGQHSLGKEAFPINDPMADLCISLFVHSRFNGSGDKPVPKEIEPEPYTICLGQVTIPWHVILRFMVSDGHAALVTKPHPQQQQQQQQSNKKEESDSETSSTADEGEEEEEEEASSLLNKELAEAVLKLGDVFPRTFTEQEVSTLVTREGIGYRIEILKTSPHAKDQSLAIQLEAMNPDDLSHKASIIVHAGLVRSTAASPGSNKVDTRLVRLDAIETFLIDNRPASANLGKKSKASKSAFVKVVQAYDKETHRKDTLYREAMERYQKTYDALWEMSGRQRILVLRNQRENDTDGEGAELRFRPDVPSMGRFHLPLWINGNEKYPFVEWQLSTLPGHGHHLPQPTRYTEQWLRLLLEIAVRRAGATLERFVAAIDAIGRAAHTVSREYLTRAALIGTEEHNELVRAVEVLCYMVCSVAHNCRYQGDGRYVNARARLRKLLRLDVETPQHDVMAGMASDGDCEDLEKLIAILGALISNGRVGGDTKDGGRGWSDKALIGLYDMARLSVKFHIFGSVNGAELKDAAGKENEEGLVGSSSDMSDDIGGHMFEITSTLHHLEARYRKYRLLVIRVTGEDLGARVGEYIDQVMLPWVDGDLELLALLRRVWASLPATVGEGTGRQEGLLLPPENYFGVSDELMRRAAMHASELDVMHQWPKEKLSVPAEDDTTETSELSSIEKTLRLIMKDHERSSSSSSSKSDAMETTPVQQLMVPSLGEAQPYSFQRRLLSESSCYQDPSSGRVYERHRSPFYRRLGHSSAENLTRICPDVRHIIWVNAEKMTYGAVLGHYLDPQGDAVPLPMPRALGDSYRGSHEMEDILAQRMRRVIPYDLSFSHMAYTETATTSASTSVSSSAPIAATDTDYSQQPFFAQSRVSWGDRPAVASGKKRGGGSGNKLAVAKPGDFVVFVTSDGAVARCIAALTGTTGAQWRCEVEGRINVRYKNDEQVDRVRDFLSKREGVTHVEVVHERLLPWLPDLLCVYFTRRLAFIINDERANASVTKKPLLLLPPPLVASDQALPNVSSACAKNKKRGEPHNHEHCVISISRHEVKRLATTLGVDTTVISTDQLCAGILAELLHHVKRVGTCQGITAETVLACTKIALEHLQENPGDAEMLLPNYYEALEHARKKSVSHWKAHTKPSVFKQTQAVAGSHEPIPFVAIPWKDFKPSSVDH